MVAGKLGDDGEAPSRFVSEKTPKYGVEECLRVKVVEIDFLLCNA